MRDQITYIHCIIEKAIEFQKNIYFFFIDYTKAFECVDHNKLWKILKVMGIPDHLTCLLRNLYAGQEATIKARHGTMDWFQIRRGEIMETVTDFILFASKITAGGVCSHEIKRCLLLGRKVMTNLDSIYKSREITLPTKVRLVKAMVFPVVMYGCKS